jgi:hypothetical protein
VIVEAGNVILPSQKIFAGGSDLRAVNFDIQRDVSPIVVALTVGRVDAGRTRAGIA